MRACAFCKKEISPDLEVFRSTECPFCARDLHICLNCVFYAPGSHWDCRESVPEAVRDKERSNFCDWFRFRDGSGPPAGGADKSASARNKLNSLFNDG